MTTHSCLPSRNEDYGFFRTLTVCPQRDRRSTEVWTLASRLIAEAIHADSEEEMIGIRDFLDSCMGRHFADDVVGNMTGCNIGLEPAIASAIRRWQDWRIDRKTWNNRGSESPRHGARMLAVGCSQIRWKYGLTTDCRAQTSQENSHV